MSIEELQELIPYENIASLFTIVGILLAFYFLTNVLVWIGQKIHCHLVMIRGKKHKCHYWTCEYYYLCPHNSVEFKLPKKFEE